MVLSLIVVVISAGWQISQFSMPRPMYKQMVGLSFLVPLCEWGRVNTSDPGVVRKSDVKLGSQIIELLV